MPKTDGEAGDTKLLDQAKGVAKEERRNWRYALYSVGATGLLLLLVLALDHRSWSVLVGGWIIALASGMVGAVAGFIFGLPRWTNLRREAVTPNSSLEEVSDWLTKIVVGVGLTQLAGLPAAIQELATFGAAALGGFTGAEVIVSMTMIFFFGVGFLIAFLWTKTSLVLLFAATDRVADTFMPEEEASNSGGDAGTGQTGAQGSGAQEDTADAGNGQTGGTGTEAVLGTERAAADAGHR